MKVFYTLLRLCEGYTDYLQALQMQLHALVVLQHRKKFTFHPKNASWIKKPRFLHGVEAKIGRMRGGGLARSGSASLSGYKVR